MKRLYLRYILFGVRIARLERVLQSLTLISPTRRLVIIDQAEQVKQIMQSHPA